MGIIKKNLNNIIKIELISAIFPNNNGELENHPYLLIEISELNGNNNENNENNENNGNNGNNNVSSNEYLNKSFGKLIFTGNTGKYKIYTNKICSIEKKYMIPINLNTLTIKIRKPNGELYPFDASDNITLDFEFTYQTQQLQLYSR